MSACDEAGAQRIVRSETAYAALVNRMRVSLAKLRMAGVWDGEIVSQGIDALWSLGVFTFGQMQEAAETAVVEEIGPDRIKFFQ